MQDTKSGNSKRNLLIRTLSGAVIFVVVVAAVLVSEYTFLALALAIALGSMWEYFRIAAQDGASPTKAYPMAVGAVAVIVSFFAANGLLPVKYLACLIPLVSIVFIAELYRKRPRPMFNISVTIGGLFYAVLPMCLMCFIAFRGGYYSPWIILYYIFIVWINDVFAYLTGMTFGRHRMFERISPKKTWEGFAGGLVFAVAAAVLFGHLYGGSLLWWGGLGVVVVVSGVYGDLVESLFKRESGIKDSGSIIPGHGGFMDRFDALLFSVPFVFLYFVIFG